MTDLGLIVDWCALHQAPRTPEQNEAFKAGLKGINQWCAPFFLSHTHDAHTC